MTLQATTDAPLTFQALRAANVTRCLKWHPDGIGSWSPAEWLTALVGEVGELASLLKMQQRERDGLAGNKFSPTRQMIADELADVQTYLDLLAFALDVDLAQATADKFNAVSERVGFPDRIFHTTAQQAAVAAAGYGVALIAAERRRQIEVEGWVPEHDDQHDDGAMAAAAACYAAFASLSDVRRNSPGTRERVLEEWPWEAEWWKPGDRIRDLAKAGALIAAEIERLQRTSALLAVQQDPTS